MKLSLRFRDVKIGALLWNADLTFMYRKVNRTEVRRVKLGPDNKYRAWGPSFLCTTTDLVWFQTREEYRAACKYAGNQTDKQRTARSNWQTLGTIARTKASLRIINTACGNRINAVQLKDIDRCLQLLGWLDKQVRHEMAAAKAQNKQQKAAAKFGGMMFAVNKELEKQSRRLSVRFYQGMGYYYWLQVQENIHWHHVLKVDAQEVSASYYQRARLLQGMES